MDSPQYMKHSYMTLHEAARQTEKRDLRTPTTAINRGICKFVGSATQRTIEHFRFDYSFLSLAQSSNALNTLELHTIYAPPRYSRLHTGKLRKKVILLPKKTYSSLFLLAFFDLG